MLTVFFVVKAFLFFCLSFGRNAVISRKAKERIHEIAIAILAKMPYNLKVVIFYSFCL